MNTAHDRNMCVEQAVRPDRPGDFKAEALADNEIPKIEALGRQVAEQTPAQKEADFGRGSNISVPTQDPAARPQSLGEAVRQGGAGD